jgi:phage tail-like protein
MTNSTALYKWHQDVIAGIIEPKNVAVILLDSEKNEAKRWTFENAFPIKWTGPDLKADNNALAIESLEIVHRGLVRVFQ